MATQLRPLQSPPEGSVDDACPPAPASRREGERAALVAVPARAFERLVALARQAEPELEIVCSPLQSVDILVAPAAGALRPATDCAALAKGIYRLRRRRERHFQEELFSEPGWDMLLDLYVAAAEGRSISVCSACHGSAAPLTTAHRWLSHLEQLGLVVREAVGSDSRRIHVRLTADAMARMDRLLHEEGGRLEAILLSASRA